MRFVPLLKTFHFIFDTLSNYYMRSIYTPANNLFMAEFVFLLMQNLLKHKIGLPPVETSKINL